MPRTLSPTRYHIIIYYYPYALSNILLSYCVCCVAIAHHIGVGTPIPLSEMIFSSSCHSRPPDPHHPPHSHRPCSPDRTSVVLSLRTQKSLFEFSHCPLNKKKKYTQIGDVHDTVYTYYSICIILNI